jgi:Winged helix-turn-helix DNA-binding
VRSKPRTFRRKIFLSRTYAAGSPPLLPKFFCKTFWVNVGPGGLTHPIRPRLLELLQQEGPATATSLAARIGRSSGVTSYYLRVLADSGFIVEDTERGNARDRFWRAPHRSTGFTLRMPDDPGTADNVEATDRYLRIVAEWSPRRSPARSSTASGSGAIPALYAQPLPSGEPDAVAH